MAAMVAIVDTALGVGGAVPGFVRLRLRLSVKPITNRRTEHLGIGS